MKAKATRELLQIFSFSSWFKFPVLYIEDGVPSNRLFRPMTGKFLTGLEFDYGFFVNLL